MSDYGKYVNRLPPGTDPALARALADVFRDLAADQSPQEKKLALFVTPQDYGAVGDGVTDDLPAFNAAIDALKTAKGGTLFIPSGVYYLNGDWSLSAANGITIIGSNRGYNLDTTTPTDSRILFDNAAHGVVITNCFSLNIVGLTIDGNTKSTTLVEVDRMKHSQWDQVQIIRSNGIGLQLRDSTGTADEGVLFCQFNNLNLDRHLIGLQHTGTTGASGVFHCTFVNTRIDFSGDAGIDLVETDNCTFVQTFIYRRTGAGAGVRWGGGPISYANQIYFYHLQAGAGGLSIGSNNTNPGAIFGYDMSNGQPFPTIPSGCSIDIATSGLNGPGWHFGRFYATVARTLGSNTAGWLFRDDSNLGIRHFNNSNGNASHLQLNGTSRALEHYINSGTGADVLIAEHYNNRSAFLRMANISVVTFGSGDATPSVAGSNHFVANNGGATTITAFDDGVDGQEITIVFANGNTTIQSGSGIKLAGGVNFTGTADDSITLWRVSSVWIEKCRSINA